MFKRPIVAATATLLGLTGAVHAQSEEFFLTYHVERFAASDLSIETCGAAVEAAAQAAGYSLDTKAYPGQLITVSGGAKSVGTYVVQCISVDDKTVTVVQGIDYKQTTGPMATFADNTFSAVKGAAKP